MQRRFAPGEQLHGFGNLQRRNQIHDRPEHADGVTGVLQSPAGCRRPKAGKRGMQ